MANLKTIGPHAASLDYELLLTTSMSRTQRDSDAVKASAGEQRRRRPSSGFHRVACCTSGEFPSCWCRGNAAHTVHTCEHGRVRPRRTMSPRYAPEGRTDPLAAPDRTKAPLRVRF